VLLLCTLLFLTHQSNVNLLVERLIINWQGSEVTATGFDSQHLARGLASKRVGWARIPAIDREARVGLDEVGSRLFQPLSQLHRWLMLPRDHAVTLVPLNINPSLSLSQCTLWHLYTFYDGCNLIIPYKSAVN
jgi:hypothetical protein